MNPAESPAQLLARSLSDPATLRRQVLGLSEREAERLLKDWQLWARPTQLMPGTPGAESDRKDWSYWLVQAGRGFGKTRCGAETVRRKVDAGVTRIALVAPTASDARDVMVEGESGLLSIYPDWEKPVYEPSKRRVTWPKTAKRKRRAIATLYSADEPERLRGPQHEFAWCDELGAWRYAVEAWDNLMFGLRLGNLPQAVITTTPRPIKILRELNKDPNTVVTRGSTYANRGNVAKVWIEKILAKYEGTRLGRQELEAELLDDIPGALWTRLMIESNRVELHRVPQLFRVVVAIDPAVSHGENSAETGIIAAGIGIPPGANSLHVYVLEDASGRYTPHEWARRARDLYFKWQADRIIGEVNNGGELVEANLAASAPDIALSYRAVRASRGKSKRAEPVSSIYEQGRGHHVRQADLEQLEDQMCAWVPGISDADDSEQESPDRMDALVWAVTELLVQPSADETIEVYDFGAAGQISPY